MVSWLQSWPSISAHTHERCSSFCFDHFICSVPSMLKTPDFPDDGQWIEPLCFRAREYSHLKPDESISKPYGLQVSDVCHSQLGWSWCTIQEEGVSLLVFGLSNIWPAVGFVCAGAEVRAAPGLQGQQKLVVTDVILIRSHSSLKAHVPAPFPIFPLFLGYQAWTWATETKPCCVEYRIPLHLCSGLLNQVSGSGSASSWTAMEETEDPVLSVRLVFHRHTLASANALPSVHPYQCKLCRQCGSFSPVEQHLLPCAVWHCRIKATDKDAGVVSAVWFYHVCCVITTMCSLYEKERKCAITEWSVFFLLC